MVDWTRKQLSDDQVRYLRELRLVAPVETFTVVHSTLDAPEMWGYVFDKLEAEAQLTLARGQREEAPGHTSLTL